MKGLENGGENEHAKIVVVDARHGGDMVFIGKSLAGGAWGLAAGAAMADKAPQCHGSAGSWRLHA